MSIFGGQQQPASPYQGQVAALAQQVRATGVERYAQMLAQSNPAFAQFLQATQGQTVSQIAAQMGVPGGVLQGLIH